MTNEISNINGIIERGKQHQQRTAEHLLAFAQCVAELRSACGIEAGGTNFGRLAQEHWGLSPSAASRFLKLGMKIQKVLGFANLQNLPPSVSALCELIQLDEGLLETLNITPDLTRQDVLNHKKNAGDAVESAAPTLPDANTCQTVEKVAQETFTPPTAMGGIGVKQPEPVQTHAEPKKPPKSAKSGDPDVLKNIMLREAIDDVLTKRPDLIRAVAKTLKQRLHPDKQGGDARLFKMLADIKPTAGGAP